MTFQLTTGIPAAFYEINGSGVTAGTAAFEWRIEDPAAVKVTFTAPGADPAEWLIARWMLMAGIGSDTFVGEGDALVRRESPHATKLRFLSAAGDAELLLSTRLIAEFLATCDEACPVGSLAEDERLAAWIGAFLLAAGVTETNLPSPAEEAAVLRAGGTS